MNDNGDLKAAREIMEKFSAPRGQPIVANFHPAMDYSAHVSEEVQAMFAGKTCGNFEPLLLQLFLDVRRLTEAMAADRPVIMVAEGKQ